MPYGKLKLITNCYKVEEYTTSFQKPTYCSLNPYLSYKIILEKDELLSHWHILRKNNFIAYSDKI
jgi:hypothetical protein